MTGELSLKLYERAKRVFPGGVNSPIRASVKPYPFYVERAHGPYIYTIDGKRLVDYVLGYGPLILGHNHPKVARALREQIERGWLYGAPAEIEVRLAEKILNHVYPNGMIRFVNSGTEAVMTAIRLARAATERKFIVKFDGCYHGASDYVLVGAGSAATEYGVPKSKGIPEEVVKLTLVARFNDIESVEHVMKRHGEEVATILLEPVIGNYGLIPAKREFIKALRELADHYQALLVFDEVITGFRLGLGGAQEYYGVRADLVVLGKVIGGGFPIGAVVGRKDLMENLTPTGGAFNAGTFNAHPVSMAAGLATISVLEEEQVFSIANAAAREVARAIESTAQNEGIECSVVSLASMAQVFFLKGSVESPDDARKSNTKAYSMFHEELLKRGVFIAPSQFEVMFTSGVHTASVVEETIGAIEESLRAVKRGLQS